jgi:hypothetical protein
MLLLVTAFVAVLAVSSFSDGYVVLPIQQSMRNQCVSNSGCWCVSSSSIYGYCLLSQSQCLTYGPSDSRCDDGNVSRDLIVDASPLLMLVMQPIVPLDFSYLANPLLCAQQSLCWCYSPRLAAGYCVPTELLCKRSASTVEDIMCLTQFNDDKTANRDIVVAAATEPPCPSSQCRCTYRFSWNVEPVTACYYPQYCQLLPSHKCAFN